MEQLQRVRQGKTYTCFTNQLELTNPQTVGDVEKTLWVPKALSIPVSDPSREAEEVSLEDGNNQAVSYSPLSSVQYCSTFG